MSCACGEICSREPSWNDDGLGGAMGWMCPDLIYVVYWYVDPGKC